MDNQEISSGDDQYQVIDNGIIYQDKNGIKYYAAQDSDSEHNSDEQKNAIPK